MKNTFALALLLNIVTTSAIAKTVTYDCSYSLYADLEGVHKETFKSKFMYDDMTGKAVLVGNLGMADVSAYSGNRGISFMELLDTGAVQTTTISKDGNSVASRHTIIGSELTPTQNYGKCNQTK